MSDAKPKVLVYRAGEHLALTKPRRFGFRGATTFQFVTSRVVVVSDDGRIVTVRPVGERSGEVADPDPEAIYELDRAAGELPVKSRWAKCYETQTCVMCGGAGRSRRWVPDPLTKPQLDALSKILEPWCPKDCPSHAPGAWRSVRYVRVPFEVASGHWEWIHLKHCQLCGRLRRSTSSVALRRAYRAPLSAVVDVDPEPTPAASS